MLKLGLGVSNITVTCAPYVYPILQQPMARSAKNIFMFIVLPLSELNTEYRLDPPASCVPELSRSHSQNKPGLNGSSIETAFGSQLNCSCASSHDGDALAL